MKNRRNNLDTMLSLLREHPPTERLFPDDDIRRTLAMAESESAPATSTPVRWKSAAITVLGAIAVGAAALFVLPNNSAQRTDVPAIAPVSVQNQNHKGNDGNGTASRSIAAAVTPDSVERTQPAHGENAERSDADQAHAGEQTNSRHTVLSRRNHTTIHALGNTTVPRSKGAENSGKDIPGVMQITQTIYDSADIARNRARHDRTDSAMDINGIGALELTPEELAQLGVEATPGGIRLFTEERYSITDSRIAEKLYQLGYDTTQKEFIKRYSVEIDTFSVGLNTVYNPTQGHYSRIVPIIIYNQYVKSEQKEGSHLSYFTRSPLLTELITAYHGSTDEMQQEVFALHQKRSSEDIRQHDLRQFPLASKLVPIYVRMGNTPIAGTNLRRGSDIYLWYYPTKEFLAALPERYRIPLAEEVDAMADVEADRLNSQEACECLTGGPSLLGICRSRSGAVVSAALYPNPAQEQTTVNFRLMEPRRVTITLHDLSGHYLSTLEAGTEMNIGDHHAALNLNQVQQGTYLVVVRTDHGEQAVQRLIVQQ